MERACVVKCVHACVCACTCVCVCVYVFIGGESICYYTRYLGGRNSRAFEGNWAFVGAYRFAYCTVETGIRSLSVRLPLSPK